jgi:signal transduction histidine kinase
VIFYTVTEPKDLNLLTNPERKRIKLTWHLSYILLGISSFYFLLKLIFNLSIPWSLFVCAFSIWVVVTTALYLGRHLYAQLFGILSLALIIFCIASSEDFKSGIHLHFISLMTITAVVFNHSQHRLVIAMLVLLFALYIASYFARLDIIPYRVFAEWQIQLFFVINLSTCAFISFYAVALLSRLNRESERVIAENSLRLQQTNEELEKFSYQVAHDLRSPVNSIRSLVGLLKMDRSSSESKRYIDLMEVKLQSLDRFITDMSDYARSGNLGVTRKSIHVKPLIEEVVSSVRLHDQHRIVFNIHSPDHLEIDTDPLRLKVILQNLIGNAIKYRDPLKEDTTIEISANKLDNQICLSIRDNGQGIHQDELPRIFDMYYRPSHKTEGIGLGLHLVKESTQKLNGTVQVDSQPGNGSTFTVYLPC